MMLSSRIRARHLAALALHLGLLALPAIVASQTSAYLDKGAVAAEFTDNCSSGSPTLEKIVVKPGVSRS